jgi:hemerythrin
MPTWNPSIAVGHPLIDEQHQELFHRADDLIEAMMQGRAAAEMEQLLVFLRDYCREHFGMEERLMVSKRYPAVEQHKLAHREFERRFQEIEKDMAAKGATSTVVLATKDLIRGWLVNHIGSIDAKLAVFVRGEPAGQAVPRRTTGA